MVLMRAATLTLHHIDTDGALGISTHLRGWYFCRNSTVLFKSDRAGATLKKMRVCWASINRTNSGRRDLREHSVQACRPIDEKTENRANREGENQMLEMSCHTLLRFGYKMFP